MDTQYDRIKSLCKESKITVTQLAEALHIHRSKMSNLHKGVIESLPTEDILNIAEYFSCSTDYLLLIKDTPTKESTIRHRMILLDEACYIGKEKENYYIGINRRSEGFVKLIKYYLFGTDSNVTDKMLAEVRVYAKSLVSVSDRE